MAVAPNPIFFRFCNNVLNLYSLALQTCEAIRPVLFHGLDYFCEGFNRTWRPSMVVDKTAVTRLREHYVISVSVFSCTERTAQGVVRFIMLCHIIINI